LHITARLLSMYPSSDCLCFRTRLVTNTSITVLGKAFKSQVSSPLLT